MPLPTWLTKTRYPLRDPISYLGADEEEVTFDYLARNAGKNKPSYKKIRLCYIE
jgi:hypothetical protein